MRGWMFFSLWNETTLKGGSTNYEYKKKNHDIHNIIMDYPKVQVNVKKFCFEESTHENLSWVLFNKL